MAQEQNNYEVPVELVFDITKTSGQMKFLGLSQKPNESDNELSGFFDWTCQACGAANRDSATLKPQQVFFAKWTCSHCSRVTLVRFRVRAVAEWIAQHTLAVTGKAMNAPAEDWQAACMACRDRQPPRRRQAVFAWLAVPLLAVIILLGLLDMRRVSNSSAAPPSFAKSALTGAGQKPSQSTPSARVVGYWVSKTRDHVLYFNPIDPVVREGTYTVARRGDKRSDTIRFKVIHEETTGEELVIHKQTTGGDRLVVQQKGSEITYRLQPESVEMTLNVSKDGKSMTRVEIQDGEPVMIVYSNAADAGGH